MTITPKTPGEGEADDHEPGAARSSNEPAAADQDQPAGEGEDAAAPEPAGSTDEPAAGTAGDPGNADAGPTPSDADDDAAGAADDSAADEAASAADATPAERAGDLGADDDSGADGDGNPGADGAPEADGPGADGADADDADGPGADGDRTQLDLSGATAEPERHGGHVTLGGRYELGDVLGTGATFTVYEARPIEDGDDGEWPLVVKVLHPHLVHDEFSRASLQREVEASERFDHPGVVKVLATGEDDVAGAVVPWTVMRRFPGRLLSEAAAGGGLPWQTALEIVADLLDGVGAVHDAGLVHRDIAPRNVMVLEREDGTYGVGLLDLGLTAPGGGDGDGETVSGSIIGMSPEQAKGQPLDLRSDLYAVGALLYYTITGHAPYERAAAQDVLRAHVEAPVPAPSARKPLVPGSVDRIVARAMAKNPVRRYPDAAGMAATIRSLIVPRDRTAGLPLPPGPTEDIARPGEPTERLDQVGGGTLRVGQIADDAAGHGRTTVVGAYVPSDEAGATETLAPVPPAPGEAARTGAIRAVSPGERPPVLPGPVPGPPGEEKPRRGRVVALAVAGVLVLGAGGVALASLLDGLGGTPQPSVSITKMASTQPKPSPSSSPSPDESGDVYEPPVVPEVSEPSVSATPSVSPSPSSSPSLSMEPTDEATPSVGPSDEATPSSEPTDGVTGEPSAEPTDGASEPAGEPSSEPSGGGGGGSGDDGDGSPKINVED
ncbi:serine/threonine-protein kinase [Myceligenerans crystallogenes]|uniref:non-specific serine/threonine protein kinase n=1 Tax=Myceligenerans crystallogenes TaxID=316335 RepID=A0ABP4ZC41_9MICO